MGLGDKIRDVGLAGMGWGVRISQSESPRNVVYVEKYSLGNHYAL